MHFNVGIWLQNAESYNTRIVRKPVDQYYYKAAYV